MKTGHAMALSAIALSIMFAGCSPKQQVKILVSMMEQQEKFLKEEIIPPFEKERKVTVDVVRMESVEHIEEEIRKYPGQAVLVKVPFGQAWGLAERNLIKPLDAIIGQEQLDEFRNSFLLTSLGESDGKQYFIPRKFETRLMVYCKSKVQDAVAVWRDHKDSLDAALMAYNGYGLPAEYLLEENPEEWDFYDVFVAGWIWARTSYDGVTMPRVAHRGRRYSGTALRVIDRVFQCNGDSAGVLAMKGDAVTDAFHWEAVYAAAGIYNRKMWEEEWTGVGVWEGFAAGEVFLSFMTQLDCFYIHGTGRDGIMGYLKNPDDMGVASMPVGCSVDINDAGEAARQGRKAITTGGWWWGIPYDTPDQALSYALGRHLTSTQNQIQDCTRFGMIPVRKDILSDMSMMFGGGWITEVYQASFQQLMHNRKAVVPLNPRFGEISGCYLDAWFDIVVSGNWGAEGVSRPHIESVLETTYQLRAEAILAK